MTAGSFFSTFRIWAFCLLGFALLASTHILHDYPAWILGLSGSYFSDEGRYASNAVNYIRFGKFVVDGLNPIFFAPVHTLLQTIYLKMGGVSLEVLRFGTVLFFSFVVLVSGFFQKKIRSAAIAMLLCPVVFFLLRFAFQEWAVVGMAIIGIALYPGNRFLAGLFLGSAFLGKTSGLIFPMGLVLAEVIFFLAEKKYFRKFLGSIGGALLAPLIFVYLLFQFADPQLIYTQYREIRVRTEFPLYGIPWFFFKMLGSSFWIWTIPLLGKFRFTFRNRQEGLAIILIVLLAGLLSTQSYQPIRYFLLFIPPMLFLADHPWRFPKIILTWPLAALVFKDILQLDENTNLYRISFLLTGALLGLFATSTLMKRIKDIFKPQRVYVLHLAVILFAIFGNNYSSLRDASRMISPHLLHKPLNFISGGGVAPTAALVLENVHPIVCPETCNAKASQDFVIEKGLDLWLYAVGDPDQPQNCEPVERLELYPKLRPRRTEDYLLYLAKDLQGNACTFPKL